MMLTCGTDSTWLPVESRIGQMAVCQPFWWRHRVDETRMKDMASGLRILQWGEKHMTDSPEGSTIELRIGMPLLNPVDISLHHG